MRPLYNNHVRQPMGHFVVLMLALLLVTVCCADMIISSIKDCAAPEELCKVELYPVSYSETNRCFKIFTAERGYLIYREAIQNPDALFSSIDHGDILYGSYPVTDEKYSSPMLWELRSRDGSIEVCVDDILALAKKSAAHNYTLAIGILVFVWGVFAGITYVLYNAPRYPRLAKLLIREEFRNF